MRHPAQAYRQFSVQGASPLGLVVMLYDGAIAALQRMVSAIEAGDVQTKCNQLNRALAIITQLEGTLNIEQGGEVAKTLKTFYVHSRSQALKANLQNSMEILRSLIQNFATVRDAWHQADRLPSPSPGAPPDQVSPPAPAAGTGTSPLRLAG